MEPCCCLRPKTGVLVFTIFDFVVNFFVVLATKAFAAALAFGMRDEIDEFKGREEIAIIIIVVVMLFAWYKICLDVYLRKVTRIEYEEGCKRWMYNTASLQVLALVFVIGEAILTKVTPFITLMLGGIWIPYKLYEMWAVYAFVKELRRKRKEEEASTRPAVIKTETREFVLVN